MQISGNKKSSFVSVHDSHYTTGFRCRFRRLKTDERTYRLHSSYMRRFLFERGMILLELAIVVFPLAAGRDRFDGIPMLHNFVLRNAKKVIKGRVDFTYGTFTGH